MSQHPDERRQESYAGLSFVPQEWCRRLDEDVTAHIARALGRDREDPRVHSSVMPGEKVLLTITTWLQRCVDDVLQRTYGGGDYAEIHERQCRMHHEISLALWTHWRDHLGDDLDAAPAHRYGNYLVVVRSIRAILKETCRNPLIATFLRERLSPDAATVQMLRWAADDER